MNFKNLMNKRVSDSRKISDRYELTYDDDAWAEAEKIMNLYDENVGWSRGGYDPNEFPRTVGLTMKFARGLNIQNPEAVYEYLEDANYHRLNTILALMGKLGKKYENEEKRVVEQYRDGNKWYQYLYDTLGFDYFKRGSVSDSRRRVKDENDDLLNRDIVILKQFYVGKANYSTDEFKDGQVCSLDEFLRKCAGIQHNVKTCDHTDCVVEQDGKYRMDFLDKKNTPEISIWFNFVDMENARLFIVSYMNKSFY